MFNFNDRLLTGLVTAVLLVSMGCAGSNEMKDAGVASNTWIDLFDGSSTEEWEIVGPGEFVLQADGTIESRGGMGLFYYKDLQLRDFVLELEWKTNTESANSGVFVRFPEAPDPWYAVNTGYEIQIDDSQDPVHQTGAVYDFAAPLKVASKGPGEWNHYRIKVVGQRYQIYLNGELVNDFYGDRSRQGMIGLQNHDDNSRVSFRNVRVMPLPDTDSPESIAEHFAVEEERDPINVLMVTATHGFRHGPAIEKSTEIMTALSATTEFDVDVTEDLADLNADNLAQYDVLFFANSTLRLNEKGGATAAVAREMIGTWGNWEVIVPSPQGELAGRLGISEDGEGGYAGGIEFDQFPGVAPLKDVEVNGDELKFKWDAGDFGEIAAAATMGDEDLDGSIAVQGNTIPLKGKRMVAPADMPAAGTYNVAIKTPQGDAFAVMILSEEDGLSGTIRPSDNAEPPMVLEELTRKGNNLSFFFVSQQLGRIDAKGEIGPAGVNGTFTLDMGELPFNGTKQQEETVAKVLFSEDQREAVLGFLRAGKGIAGAHAGLDAFYEWEEYKAMVGGGLFESHPWTEHVDIVVEEKNNPATAHFGDSFSIRDEIYVLDENPRWNARVLMSLDMDSVEPEADSRGNYRNDYPISWIREHEGGRVFITKLGHFPDVWTSPDFLQHVLQGLRMVAGRIDADFSGKMVKETIADNVWPDDIAIDERGNVWIAELRGKVHRYDAESGETTLIGQVETTDPINIEHGLYGIEVDPEFYAGSPYIYLFYAEQESIINTLSRFTYRDGAIDFASEEVLLRVPTEPQCCHQAGDIEWAPDGTLYLSTGDTGMSETRPEWEVSEEDLDAFKKRNDLEEIQWSRLVDSERTAQNLQDLRGKILRINKDGSIPRDNPFYGDPGVRWEIYAYGLRNPYRFKVDPNNGHLYIGVVGPDAQFDYDEYNISREGGENFGWPREIGRLVYNEWSPDMIPNYHPPMWEYDYEGGGRSASGGPIYRYQGPGAFPPMFQNRVFIYDWARGWIKYGLIEEQTIELEKTNGEKYEVVTPRLVDVKTLDILRGTRPISMEIGPDGAIYVAEFTGFWDAAPGSKVTRYRWVSRSE